MTLTQLGAAQFAFTSSLPMVRPVYLVYPLFRNGYTQKCTLRIACGSGCGWCPSTGRRGGCLYAPPMRLTWGQRREVMKPTARRGTVPVEGPNGEGAVCSLRCVSRRTDRVGHARQASGNRRGAESGGPDTGLWSGSHCRVAAVLRMLSVDESRGAIGQFGRPAAQLRGADDSRAGRRLTAADAAATTDCRLETDRGETTRGAVRRPGLDRCIKTRSRSELDALGRRR